MTSKAAILAISLGYLFHFSAGEKSEFSNFPSAKEINIQDSIPLLHTIAESDIERISTSFSNQTITVRLKSGTEYTYQPIDWDLEDANPLLNKALRDSLKWITVTFTKVEHDPEFPGGEEAWKKYIWEYCNIHTDAIENEGTAKFRVQFKVHLRGQITDLRILMNYNNSDLSPLAMEVIHNSPAWIPATQNGYKVVAYKYMDIVLSLKNKYKPS
jgi:hypothetical protein